jgi:hypothetical protein
MVMPTARADLPVLLQILGVGQSVTGRTLLPEAVGNLSYLTLFVEGAATCQVQRGLSAPLRKPIQ